MDSLIFDYASRFLFYARSVQSTSLETSSYLADVLWRHWLCRDLKENDLVLIVDENIPQGQ